MMIDFTVREVESKIVDVEKQVYRSALSRRSRPFPPNVIIVDVLKFTHHLPILQDLLVLSHS